MNTSKSKLLTRTSIAAMSVMAFSATNSFAQGNNDEIIVTARKQESTLLDAPLAITALGNAELENADLADIVEFTKLAPGVFIEPINGVNARVNSSPRFRGVTFETNDPLRRTASIFVDGILSSGDVGDLGTNEIERIEIIKGPQAAVFGRNTFSGAINYITKSPSDEFRGDVSVLAATRDEYRVSGSLEGPILGDTLTGRISGMYDSNGAHYESASEPDQKLGEEKTWAVSAVTEFKPNDAFRLRVRGSYSKDRDGAAPVARVAGFSEHNFGPLTFADGSTGESVFRGTIRTPSESELGTNTSQAGFALALDRLLNDGRGRTPTLLGYDFDDLDNEGGLIADTWRIAADATYEFNENIRLDILGGISEYEYLVLTDFDATPTFGFTTTGVSRLKDTSIEARLSGSLFEDRLDWSLGGNYLDIDRLSNGGFWDGRSGFWFSGVFSPIDVTGAETLGVFGTLDYKLTDQVTLIAEGRYQIDKVFEDAANAGLTTPVSPGEFEEFLPRFLLQYEPSDNATFYANYSVGSFPGGFNPEIGTLNASQLSEFQAAVPGVEATFDPERLTNYELGWKQTMFDGDVAFNLAAFFMKRTDQIFSAFQLVRETPELFAQNGNEFRTVAYTANGATSDIKGFELDGTIRTSDHLTLQGTLAYVDAKQKSFPADSNSGDFTAVFGPDASVEGQRSPRFPTWSGSLTGTYERPINGNFFGSSDASWYTRGDLFYTGEFFDENTNLAENASAVDVNWRVGIRKDNIRLEAFVTNLFQEDTPIGANNVADTAQDVRDVSSFDFSQESVHVWLRDKRQFGVRLDVDF